MDTFRRELISYHCDQKRLKGLQGQVNKLKLELENTAEIICNHADAVKGQALLVMADLESEMEQGIEPFTVFISQPVNWQTKDPTELLKLQTLTEIKSRSRPDIGSTPDPFEETT